MSENTIFEINQLQTLVPTPIPISSVKQETYIKPPPEPVVTSLTSIKEESHIKPVSKRRNRINRQVETDKKDDVSKIPNEMVNNIQTLKINKYILEDDGDTVPNRNISLNYNFKKTLGLRYF
tara:strand:+ start:1650 stop:2015 length:366 start_codon:yes stop_codon:yes gene_type:complete